MGIFHPSLICSPFSVLVIPMHDAKTSRFSKLSVQAAHHQSLISRRNLILQNLEHGKHRKILQTCDNLSLKRSTAADFIAVESCFFRRLPVFDLQYYIPELRSARGEDMSSHQNSSIRSAAQGLATTIRKWYLGPHGHWHRIHSGFYQGMFECIKTLVSALLYSVYPTIESVTLLEDSSDKMRTK